MKVEIRGKKVWLVDLNCGGPDVELTGNMLATDYEVGENLGTGFYEKITFIKFFEVERPIDVTAERVADPRALIESGVGNDQE